MKYCLYLTLILLCGCVPDRTRTGEIEGYVPVYLPTATAKNVTAELPTSTKNPGKIYAHYNYIFQIDQGAGIHVIDNTNPSQAKKIKYITVPGCAEIAVKGNYIYTNNINDLVVIDITNITAPTVVSRQVNAFPQVNQNYPPFTGVYYECADPEKGIVVGWEPKMIKEPLCRR